MDPYSSKFTQEVITIPIRKIHFHLEVIFNVGFRWFFSSSSRFWKWQFVTMFSLFSYLKFEFRKNWFLEVRVNLWLGMTTPQSLQNYAFFTARWSDDIVAVFDRLFCYYQVFQGFNFVTLIGKNPRKDKKLNSILYNDSLKNVQLFWNIVA